MPCVFCRSTEPLTNEHAIPGWIGKHLGQGSVTHNYIPWKASEPAWTYKKKELSIEAKAVCESCNTGWMSDLEDDVAPILGPLIDGEERLLGATNRELLAAWATKTVLMIQQAMPTAARVSTGADYQNFYARRRPPRDARLWLAASGGAPRGLNRSALAHARSTASSPRELLGGLPLPRPCGLSDRRSGTLEYTGAPS